MKNHNYFIYILASNSGTLYIGITNNLERRMLEHEKGIFEGFSKAYGCNKLVYFENSGDINAAIAREKQLKGWTRIKKENLIRSANPKWIDLSDKWFKRDPSTDAQDDKLK